MLAIVAEQQEQIGIRFVLTDDGEDGCHRGNLERGTKHE
jgi:hypothetical protein